MKSDPELNPDSKYGPNLEYWVTKDGRRLLISEMEDSHLLNTIRMLNHKFDNYVFDYILSLPRPHGDGACMAFENEIVNLADAGPGYCWPVYYSLEAEAYNRGLFN